MWTKRQSQLAVLLASLGGATWWLLQTLIVEPPPRPRGRAPSYIVSDLNAIETDVNGRPKQRLVADQLRQFVDEDRSELDAPRLTQFDPDGAPPWQVRSDHGLLLSRGTEVHLNDNVRIDRAGTAKSRSLRLETTELKIWPKREYAQGDHPVRIDSDGDWLTAIGVKAWYATPSHAEFGGRVHIGIAPAQAASAGEVTP